MATYIVEASERENRETERRREILTQNRLQTIQKREVSLEQLIQSKNNEEIKNNYIHSLEVKKNENKNKFLCLKDKITAEDLQNPFIKQIEDTIQYLKWYTKKENLTYIDDIPKIKTIIIELRKDQYVVKQSINHTIKFTKIGFQHQGEINYYQNTGYIDSNNSYKYINNSSFYFHKLSHIAALIQNYQLLKETSANEIQSTIYWILVDFEQLIKYASNYNLSEKHLDVLTYKMHGYTNEEIHQLLVNKYGKGYSKIYIGTLLNHMIPRLLVESYNKYITEWVHTYKMYGQWKKCTKCGQILLANGYNFSLNKRGKFGYHSICKKCRTGGVKK